MFNVDSHSVRGKSRRLALGAAACWVGLASVAWAKPEAPVVYCATYPNAAQCMGKVPACQHCHVSTFPASWNAYGQALQSALDPNRGFGEALPEALMAVEELDSDADGASNLDEIFMGTEPGDGGSSPSDEAAPEAVQRPNPDYRVGEYDPAFAYKRASILYCGHSPSYEAMQPFRDPSAQASQLRQLLHERVQACLDGDYWIGEGLPRLADDRIRPIANLGQDSEVFITIPVESLAGEVKLRSTMGDYRFDYRLWVHALSGSRDARDLLLAQYFVVEHDDGSWALTEDLIPKADQKATAGGQLLERPYRAGMITTMWFLTRNTMFSALPRTTAAAAYRSYLGADISKMEGLIPVAGEPDDIDKKGVDAPRCAVCHSTLDPLAYAFAPYTGFSFSIITVANLLVFGELSGDFGIYDPTRPTTLMPGWSDAEQQPVLFGKPVDSLRAWAEMAAESDAFARNLATIFYKHALWREPEGADLGEFTQLWEDLREEGYVANRMIHRLIDTNAFGVP